MTSRSLTPEMFAGSRPLGTFHTNLTGSGADSSRVYGSNTRVSAPLNGLSMPSMYNQAAESFVSARQQLQQQRSVSAGGTTARTSQPITNNGRASMGMAGQSKDQMIAPSSQPSQLYQSSSMSVGRGLNGQLGSGGAYAVANNAPTPQFNMNYATTAPANMEYIPGTQQGYTDLSSLGSTVYQPASATSMHMQLQLQQQMHNQQLQSQQADKAKLAQLTAVEDQLAMEELNIRAKMQELVAMNRKLDSDCIESQNLMTALVVSQSRLHNEPILDRSDEIARGEDRVIEARAVHEDARRTLEECELEMAELAFVAEQQRRQKDRLVKVKEAFSQLDQRRRAVRDTTERLVEIESERCRVLSRHCAALEPVVLKFAPSMALRPLQPVKAPFRASGRAFAADPNVSRESQQPKRSRIEIEDFDGDNNGFNQTYPPATRGGTAMASSGTSNRGSSFSTSSVRTTTAAQHQRPPTIALQVPGRPSATMRFYPDAECSNRSAPTEADDTTEEGDNADFDYEQSMQFSLVDHVGYTNKENARPAASSKAVNMHSSTYDSIVGGIRKPLGRYEQPVVAATTAGPSKFHRVSPQYQGHHSNDGYDEEDNDASYLIPEDEGDSMAFSLVH